MAGTLSILRRRGTSVCLGTAAVLAVLIIAALPAWAAPKPGGTAVMAQAGNIPTVDPHFSGAGETRNVVTHVYEGLMALDEKLHVKVAMAEAPHGTAPSLRGKNVANPMAMLLANAALLDQAAARLDDPRFAVAGARLRNATLEGAAAGYRTFDLGGDSSTSGVVDDVIARLRASI